MKYMIETNADNGDSFYSEEFDTVVEAIEEMAYRWRLLLPTKESEFRRMGYLSSDRVTPYMVALKGMTEETTDIFTHTTYAEAMTLAEMIEPKENEEKED